MCLVRPLVPTAGFEPCRSGPGAAPLTTAPRRLLIDTVLAPPYLYFGTPARRRRERIRKLLDRRLLRGVWRRWIRDGFGGGGFAKRVWRRWIRFETGLEAVDSQETLPNLMVCELFPAVCGQKGAQKLFKCPPGGPGGRLNGRFGPRGCLNGRFWPPGPSKWPFLAPPGRLNAPPGMV
jgi:hypothetical protein